MAVTFSRPRISEEVRLAFAFAPAGFRFDDPRHALSGAAWRWFSATLAAVACGAQASEHIRPRERFEVTGSHVKRIDTETAAPVEIIDRETIERTGLPTVGDVLRAHPATSANVNESFANSFAPGSAGISLRGLGQKTTLVLLNGRRTASYGYAQNRQETFVDLNSIPLAAVERIEILKDGASAIYGSDAIAGVINVILRRDFRGANVAGGVGRSEGKGEHRVSVAGGVGDLALDGYNAFGVLDVLQRDELRLADTKMNHSADMRGHEGGRNFTSLNAGGTWQPLAPGNPPVRRAIAECAGQVLDGLQAVEAGLISRFTTTAGLGVAENSFCTRDFNKDITALPGVERIGFLGRASMALNSRALGYVEAGLNRSTTSQAFTPATFAGAVAYTETSDGFLSPFAFNVTFGPGVAGNPFTTNARFSGNLSDIGLRTQEIESTTLRLLAGLQFEIGGWDVDAAASWSRNELESQFRNFLTRSGISAAFGLPLALTVPVATSSAYNLDRWSLNSDAVRDSIRGAGSRRATSELRSVDARASRELGALGGGPIGLALGAEHRAEEMRDGFDDVIGRGDAFGGGIAGHRDSRTTSSAFAELLMPFSREWEAQVALRSDHYSDYGTSTTPKLGIRWRAHEALVLRATWGRGFHAPTLPETSHVPVTQTGQAIDPLTGDRVVFLAVFVGNPDLRPEHSVTATAGLVWQPTQDLSAAIGWYEIDWRDIVVSRNLQSVIDAGDPALVIRDPATGAITTVISRYTNIERTSTSGIDVDFRARVRSSAGQWTFRGAGTWVRSFREQGVEAIGTNGAQLWSRPRVRGVLGLDWERAGWGATVAYNYVSGIRETFLANSVSASQRGFHSPQDPRFQNGVLPERSAHHRTWDVYVRYRPMRRLTFTASVINAENKSPPYDPSFSPYNFDPSLYDARGRQVRVGFAWDL